MTTVNN